MNFKKIIFLDTNLKPANKFYRNLMTQAHTEIYGEEIIKMFEEERIFYRKELLKSIQDDFDFTHLLSNISQKVYAIYGDRGISYYPSYSNSMNSYFSTNLSKLIFISYSPNSSIFTLFLFFFYEIRSWNHIEFNIFISS